MNGPVVIKHYLYSRPCAVVVDNIIADVISRRLLFYFPSTEGRQVPPLFAKIINRYNHKKTLPQKNF